MKETRITIYPFGAHWYVKVIYPFKVHGGVVVFESAVGGSRAIGVAKKLANRIKKVHDDADIPTVVEVVERPELV